MVDREPIEFDIFKSYNNIYPKSQLVECTETMSQLCNSLAVMLCGKGK